MPDAAPNPLAPPVARPAWQRNLPNALTLARVAMTAAFVAVLSIYRFPDTNSWALPVALVLFVVAALTDALDGYLARKWQVVSVFGRIMDPFADKVLILGAFVMLAGPQFQFAIAPPVPEQWRIDNPGFSDFYEMHASGVLPWMAVIMLARELLVTTIRAVMEAKGIDFSASWSGKIKMIAQSLAVPVAMLIAIFASNAAAGAIDRMAEIQDRIASGDVSTDWIGASWKIVHSSLMTARGASTLNGFIGLVVTLITAISAISYITRAISALRSPPGSATL